MIIDISGEVPIETDEVAEDAWAKEYRKMMKGEKEKEKRDRFATADFKLPKATFSFFKLVIPLKSLFIAMSKFIRHYGYFFFKLEEESRFPCASECLIDFRRKNEISSMASKRFPMYKFKIPLWLFQICTNSESSSIIFRSPH